MFNGAKGLNLACLEPEQGLRQVYDISIPANDFEVRKFPEMGVHYPSGALPNQQAAAVFCHKRRKSARGRRSLRRTVGQARHSIRS